jgi:tetratricopeptide (TPR) repeat protein
MLRKPLMSPNQLFIKALQIHMRGNLESAMEHYHQILDRSPNHAETLHHLGLAMLQGGRVKEAIPWIRKSIKVNPRQSDGYSNLGYCLNLIREHEEALRVCRRSIELNMNNDGAWTNLGNAQRELRLLREAQVSYETALELQPKNSRYTYNLANAFYDLKNFNKAKSLFQEAIALEPSLVEAHNNLAVCLINLKNSEKALEHTAIAIRIKPNYAEAWNTRGNSLNDLKRYEEAVASYERCIELNPDHAEAWNNRGNSLNDLKRYEEAVASYERCIELNPDHAEAHFNKGYLQLTQYNFSEGFKNYLWRWKTKYWSTKLLQTSLPLHNHKSFAHHVLFWAEQGLGDEIFYASMLPQAKAICSKITFATDKRLVPIFKRSLPDIDFIDKNLLSAVLPGNTFDAQTPIGNLGYLLQLDSGSITHSRKPFLLTDSIKTLQMRHKPPFTSQKVVCGLSWKSKNKAFGIEKSMKPEDFEPLFKSKLLSFVNLQYGDVDTDIQHFRSRLGSSIYRVKDLDLFNDIDGLLSLIDACDIVITASNVTAHLAGSIGKKGCVLVPFSKGRVWYWHVNDLYSLWYPSLRVFYQDNPNSWTNTIEQVISWLEKGDT